MSRKGRVRLRHKTMPWQGDEIQLDSLSNLTHLVESDVTRALEGWNGRLAPEGLEVRVEREEGCDPTGADTIPCDEEAYATVHFGFLDPLTSRFFESRDPDGGAYYESIHVWWRKGPRKTRVLDLAASDVQGFVIQEATELFRLLEGEPPDRSEGLRNQ